MRTPQFYQLGVTFACLTTGTYGGPPSLPPPLHASQTTPASVLFSQLVAHPNLPPNTHIS